jgi:hypothetical protein
MATDWRVQFKRAQKGGEAGAAAPPPYQPGEAPWDGGPTSAGRPAEDDPTIPACWADGETFSREGAQGKVCGRCSHRDSCDATNQEATVGALHAGTHTTTGSSRGFRPSEAATRPAAPAAAPRAERPECFGWEDAYDSSRYGCAVCPSRAGCSAAISDLQARRTAKMLG